MNIEELNNKKAKILENLRDVNEAIEDLEQQEIIPSLKKELEGKCFRYDNGYSLEKRWYMYTKVREVIDSRQAIVDTFQAKSDGFEFSVGETTFINILGEPIKKSEWNRELKKFKKAIEKV